MTYSSVEVSGDTPVVIEDGVPGAITLGGVPYDVRVTAQEEVHMPCSDDYALTGVALDIQAARLDELLATLDVGPPPACSQGNEPDVVLFFGMTEVGVSTTYEGVVSYIGPDTRFPDAYAFEIPGLAGLTGGLPVLYIEGAPALLPEPALGQEFWLSFPSLRVQALQETQGGPVLLAQNWGDLGNDGTVELGNLLGVAVRLEDVCDYAPSAPLQDTVFATTPEVRVPSGTTGTLVIGGRTYRAFAWGQGRTSVSIYPAN